MRSALIHGVLLAVMLVYGYRTWTRDKTVKPDLGSVVLWNKPESELASIEYKSEKKTVRLEHKADGKGEYWWGTETSVEKKPKPKPPEKKPDVPAQGSGSAGSGSAAGSAGSGSAGSGSQVAAGSGSAGSGSAAKPPAGSGSGSQVAAGSGSAGSGSGSAGSGSQVAAGSGSAGSGSGSAAKPPAPPVEMVETTKRREFPLGDGGDKLIATYTDARALGEFGSPTADQLVDYKLATVPQIEAKLAEVKKELEQVKATEAADKELEKDEPKDPKAKKGKKDDKKPELTKKIKELEDLKKATDGKPKTTLTVTFKDGTNRVFQIGGAVFGPSGDRYVLDTQSGVAFVLKKEMLSGLEVGESSLQLTDPRGFDATKIEQVEIDWNGRKKLAKRTQTADASDKQVKTWTDADTGKANQSMATFIDNVNNLRPTEYAKDVKVDTLAPIFKLEYRDATAKLGSLALYKIEKPPVIPEGTDFDPANPPKGEIEYYVLTERTRVPALVRRDPAKKSEDDLPIVFGDKAAPVAPKPNTNPFGNVPIKGGSGAPSPLGGAGKDPHGH